MSPRRERRQASAQLVHGFDARKLDRRARRRALDRPAHRIEPANPVRLRRAQDRRAVVGEVVCA
ncbi:MAG: hypothetical protein WD051_00840 [Steroidobacteraceae bacterium]